MIDALVARLRRRRLFRYIWAAPTSALGLVFLLLALRRGHYARVDGVIECAGPWVARVLRSFPPRGGVAAIALGHIVAGRDRYALDWTRAHERVHVTQAERWGPLFVPAYLVSGLAAAVRGGHPYFDNAFEREARRADAQQARPLQPK